MEDDRTPLPESSGGGDGDVVGEARWPMVGAVVTAIVLTLLLPDDLRLGPNWALPVLEVVLLVTLIAGDPGSITRRSRELRAVGIGDGSSRTGLFIGYVIGGAIMITGGIVELAIGIKAEGKSLEDITKPITSTPESATAG